MRPGLVTALLTILIIFFIIFIFLLVFFIQREFSDATFKIVCYDYFFKSQSPFPLISSVIVPIATPALYVLAIILCATGIFLGVKDMNRVDIKAFLFLSLIVLLIIMLMTINQLRLFIAASCPA